MIRTGLHVAMIIQSYLPRLGGAERQINALAPLLKRRGVEISVLTRRYSGLPAFERINDVPVYRLPVPGPKAAASLSFTLFALLRLASLRPDILHAHELLSPATTAVTARKLFRKPVVAKVLRGGQLGDIAKLKGSPARARRIPILVRSIDRFIVISQEIDRELSEIGVPAERRVFIPNGVDLDRFAPLLAGPKQELRASLGLPPGILVLYAGRLTPEKNVASLLKIWPEVQHCIPSAQLLIAGSGEEEAALRRAAGDGVHFLGYQDDIAPILKASDLFVLPSSTEGLSNALLEAMAAGLPVVATAVGGAPDLLSDRRTGDLCGMMTPPDDLPALQSAIVDLLAPPAQPLRNRMGNQARLRVAQDYGLQSTADQLADLYRRLQTNA